MKTVRERVEQVIRNLQRRKYSRLCGDYANGGFDLFNENQFARDLGIKRNQLKEILLIQRTTPLFGIEGIMFAPSAQELRDAIPKIEALTLLNNKEGR